MRAVLLTVACLLGLAGVGRAADDWYRPSGEKITEEAAAITADAKRFPVWRKAAEKGKADQTRKDGLTVIRSYIVNSQMEGRTIPDQVGLADLLILCARNETDPSNRFLALEAVGPIASEKLHLKELCQLAKAGWEESEYGAVIALGYLGDGAVPTLTALLKKGPASDNNGPMLAAIDAMERIGTPKASEVLTSLRAKLPTYQNRIDAALDKIEGLGE